MAAAAARFPGISVFVHTAPGLVQSAQNQRVSVYLPCVDVFQVKEARVAARWCGPDGFYGLVSPAD